MNEKIKDQLCELCYAINATNAVYGKLAKKLGISYNALMILYSIEENKNCTQKHICEELQFSKSTVHSILLDFIKKGYMYLELSKDNKKEKIIYLTPKGEEYLNKIMSKVHSIEIRAMEKLGENLRKQLVKSSIEFYKTLNKEVEDE